MTSDTLQYRQLLERIQAAGLTMPEPSAPGGSYVSVNVRGTLAFVAIQFPIINGKYLFQGRLGRDFTTAEGYHAMQLCVMNILAQISAKVGIERIVGVNHIDAYYQSVEGWDDAPKVVNGASDLLLNLLGEKGVHTRAIFGVQSLPRNLAVGVTSSFTIEE